MLASLYGCGKRESQTTPQSQSPSNIQPPAAAAAGALSKADLSVPFSSYQQLGSDAAHWMAMYYGTANVNPIPFDKFANRMIYGYNDETNPFTKQNWLKKIVPEVTQMVAASQKNRYYVMDVDSVVGDYDMTTKAFPIGALREGDSDQMFSNGSQFDSYATPGYALMFSNGSQFDSYPVIDQSTAENLENTIHGMNNGVLLKIYFYAQGTEHSHSGSFPDRFVVAQITRVDIYPQNNTTTPLFKIGSGAVPFGATTFPVGNLSDREDSVQILGISPAAGSTLRRGAPLTFNIRVAYSLQSMDTAILSMSVAQVREGPLQCAGKEGELTDATQVPIERGEHKVDIALTWSGDTGAATSGRIAMKGYLLFVPMFWRSNGGARGDRIRVFHGYDRLCMRFD